MKNLAHVFIMFLLTFPFPSFSQIDYLFDPSNPLSLLYDDDSDGEVLSKEFILADSLIAVFNVDYLILEKHPEILYKKSYKDGEVKRWEIIAARDDYYILCANDYNRGKCKCRDDLYIFIPQKRLIQSIHPWYAPPFYTKTRLIKTINELSSENIDVEEFDRYCDLIKFLRKE